MGYSIFGGNGMLLSINGTEPTILVANGMGYVPAVFTITNDGDEAADYTLVLTYPAGTMSNPAELKLGSNSVDLAEGSDGYFYTWTAEEDGNFSLEMSGENWFYVINNTTTCTYGDAQYSDSDPVMNPSVVSVGAGDVLEIIVNTYDPSIWWGAPAGTIEFTASFTPAQ